MRAERLTRKTHFKKASIRPGEDVAFYDLTKTLDEKEPGQIVKMSDVEKRAHKIEAGIMALPYAFNNHSDIVQWCGLLMMESPTARKLWGLAEAEDWSVSFMDLQSGGFYLDIPQRILYLDHFSMTPGAVGRSVYFRNAVVSTFIRALRDIWHEYHSGAFETRYAPEDVLMLERVRAADSDTVTILAGWELRGAGYAEIWRHLIGAPEGDMALIFSRFLERDPRALFTGTALAYAFRQWFADETRVDGSDHDTLEALDDQFLDYEGQKTFGQTVLTDEMIESLSILPDGTSYLAGYGETIKDDPFFAGLNDPINQTHLFHLMYDMEVTMVNDVPFRDRKLAQLIFPEGRV